MELNNVIIGHLYPAVEEADDGQSESSADDEGRGEKEETDSEGDDEFTLKSLSGKLFDSREEAINAVEIVGRAKGFAMGIRTSKKKKPKNGGEGYERVVLACDKRGCAPELKRAGGYLRETSTRRTGCLCEVVLTKRVGQQWELIVGTRDEPCFC
jgi:hypothetical protein